MRRWLALALVLALLAPAGAAQTRFADQMEWTSGTFHAGLLGAGESVFPEGAPAVDHERLDFAVSPCHRDLELDLLYHPAGAGVDTDPVTLQQPYRFRYSLYDPAGERLFRDTVDEPDHGYPLPTVDRAGDYTLQLELLDGARVHWEARVQGWGLDVPSCEVWLNEVEPNPAGPDAGHEWVEVYNEGAQAFDLTGWSIRAELRDRSTTYPVPDGTQVPAGGYAAVDLDGEEPVPDTNATVQLVPPAGGELDASPPVDDTRDGAGTHQRVPDGSNDWRFLDGTRGTSNGP